MGPAQRLREISLEERRKLEQRLLRPRAAAPTEPAIPRRDPTLACPLSFSQQRLWFLEQMFPGSAVYHVPLALRGQGALNQAALQQALDGIVSRHEALRTNFVVAADGEPVQVVQAAAAVPLRHFDLRSLPDEQREAEMQRLFLEESRRPFDLTRDLMVRAATARLQDDAWGMLIVLHHIAADGWSVAPFVRELTALYEASHTGRPVTLPELSIQFADFAVWQRGWMQGEVLERQLAYWRQQLAGVANLELPLDHPRPVVQTSRGASLGLDLGPELLRSLQALSREEGATLFMTLLAAMQVLMHRYTGQDDISVGAPVAARNRVEVEPLIGFFVNTLVLRTNLSGGPTFRQVLQRVREVALGAFTHQDVPFEKLVQELAPERDTSRSPLFQVLFVFHNNQRESVHLPGLTLARLPVEYRAAKFDLQLTVGETAGGLRGSLLYNQDLFEEATVRRLLGHYRSLLEAAVQGPDQAIAALPLLTPEEHRQIVTTWNDTRSSFPLDQCVHDLVASQVRRSPDAVAVVFGKETLTYQELSQKANRVANYLREAGIGPEARVGLCVERSLDMVVGMLGILASGAAYVPLDPHYPKDRLAFMVEDARLGALLTQERLRDRGLLHLQAAVTCFDTDWPRIARGSPEAPTAGARPENLAYLLYTSGSTGRPKGVAMPHRPLVNLLAWQLRSWAYPGAAATLQFASMSFDVSFQEIFATLSSGGTLFVLADEVRHDPRALAELLAEQEVRRAYLPPVVLHHLAEAAESLGRYPRALREIIVAGEQLQITRPVAALMARLEGCVLQNHYGPTEAHVVTSFTLTGPPDGWPALAPIGAPIANTQIYLFDRHRRPVPIGVPGELHIGGTCLARGYLGRPDLTAEKFIPHPLSDEPGARLYRTGDLARYRADGVIEFLGRIDHQVKVRGFRIELGEIEAVLGQHPGVRQSVVVAREDVPGDKRLAAYVVAATEPPPRPEELRRHVAERLPVYMVPAAFVLLDALPLSPNGKVDRKVLPVPDADTTAGAEERVAPRDEIEEELVRLWEGVLHRSPIGIHDNFFDIGGHSLLAAQVMARIEAALGQRLPLRALFESPTVAQLAAIVRRNAAPHDGPSALPAQPAILPRDRTLPCPLSFSQQRLWFLEKFDPGHRYHVPFRLRMRGPLNEGALREALDAILTRHEVLRTRFPVVDGEPVQEVIAGRPLAVPVTDLSDRPEAEREATMLQFLAAEEHRPFDLVSDLMVRAVMVRMGPEDHCLLVVLHHIVCDAWSMSVLFSELSRLYEAFAAGKEPELRELPIQYGDFAVWQRERLRGQLLDEQVGFWREHLAGAPAVLELPTDRPRSLLPSTRSGHQPITLPGDLAAAIKALAREEEATLFITLLAAFQALLCRCCRCDDIVVGTTIAGRTHVETEPLIGFFINTLPLRARFHGSPTFRTVLRQVRDTVLQGIQHQEAPFEKLVEELNVPRNVGINPIFQVLFQLQNVPRETLRLGGLTMTGLNLGVGAAKFDLTLSMREHAAVLQGGFNYNADLFDDATIIRLGASFRTLLTSIVADPDCRVGDLALLPDEEKQQVLVGFNATAIDYGPPACLHELIAEQLARTPDAIAVSSEGQTLTCCELDERANQLGHYLRGLGIGPGDLVGVCAERSLELVVALLGVLKSGAAYVPLDPGYPAERLAFMLQDANVPVLLTQQRLLSTLPRHTAQTVCLDTDWGKIASQPRTAPETSVSPAHPAYMIYTSGSTGRPKGALNSHRGIVNRLLWMQQEYRLGHDDVVLQKTPFSFDVSVWEFFWPLLAGARLAVARPGGHQDPAYLAEVIAGEKVTTLHFVPPMLQVFLEVRGVESSCRSVRRVVCSGEALPLALSQRFYALLPKVELHNLYGPTEAAVDVTYWHCERVPSRPLVPIGKPVANTRVYIVDDKLRPCPVGVPGELLLGGVQVGMGYRHRPALTAEKFVPDPFAGPGARLYRTGDVVRWLSDGAIEYLGRMDHQVKVRGFRIELGEVQSALESHPAVRQAVVVAWEALPGDKRLVAYVAASASSAPTPGDLQAFLKERLPAYMVPAYFVFLEALPLSANGKVDRKALPPPEAATAPEEMDPTAPRDSLEVQLVMLWEEVLQRGPIGIHDNFFDLGGHSLLAFRLFSRIESIVGEGLPLRALFEAPTIAGLAELLRRHAGTREWPTLVPVQPKGSRLPIFCVAKPNVNALGCVFLARRLGNDQPLYVLQSHFRTEDHAPYTTAEYVALATEYIREMRALRPHGPYLLAGFCEGAHIAFEMGRQLQEQGCAVGMLAIFDAWPVENTRNYLLWRVWAVHWTMRKFLRLGWRDRSRVAGNAMRGFFGKLFRRPSKDAPQQQPVNSKNGGFVQRYWPGKDFKPPQYAGKILVFRVPQQPYWRVRDKTLGWGAWTTVGVEVHDMTGAHGTFLREPHVEVLAEKLQKCIAALPRQPKPEAPARELKPEAPARGTARPEELTVAEA